MNIYICKPVIGQCTWFCILNYFWLKTLNRYTAKWIMFLVSHKHSYKWKIWARNKKHNQSRLFILVPLTHQRQTAGLSSNVEEVGVVADHQVLEAGEQGDAFRDVNQPLVGQVKVTEVQQLQDLHRKSTLCILIWKNQSTDTTGSCFCKTKRI